MIGVVGVIAGIGIGLVINLSLGQVGMDYSQMAGVAEYIALISGRVYPTLGLNNIAWRSAVVLIIAVLAALIPAIAASRREPSEALHHV
jgi:ABC-type antimicrobial peptide transport system permease subunit